MTNTINGWDDSQPIVSIKNVRKSFGGTVKLTNEGGLRSHYEWCFRVDRGLQTPH